MLFSTGMSSGYYSTPTSAEQPSNRPSDSLSPLKDSSNLTEQVDASRVSKLEAFDASITSSETSDSNAATFTPACNSLAYQLRAIHDEYAEKSCIEIGKAIDAIAKENRSTSKGVHVLRTRTNSLHSDFNNFQDSFTIKQNSMSSEIDYLRKQIFDAGGVQEKLIALEKKVDEQNNTQLMTEQKIKMFDSKFFEMSKNQSEMEVRLRTDIIDLTSTLKNLNELSGALKGCNETLMQNQCNINQIIQRSTEKIDDIEKKIELPGYGSNRVEILVQSPQRNLENDSKLDFLIKKVDSLSPTGKPRSPRQGNLLARVGGGYEDRWLLPRSPGGPGPRQSDHRSRSFSPGLLNQQEIRESIARRMGSQKFPTLDDAGRLVYTSVKQL